jgi:NADPH:quinone reductase-like Zn-dependent oxidoreductase/acyl carrier protein
VRAALPQAVLNAEAEPPFAPGLVICEWLPTGTPQDGAGWAQSVAEAGWNLLGRVRQVMAFASPERPVRLIVLTRGALRVRAFDPAPDLTAASLWGVLRSLMKERTDLEILAVDLPADPTEDPPAEVLVDYFLEQTLAREAAWRRGEFLLRGIRHVAANAASPAEAAGPATDGVSARLEIGTPGRWETLDFRAHRRRRPGSGEIEVRVNHAALNYKDALKAAGLAPAVLVESSASGLHLGLECAGTVERAGDGTRFQPGDDVLCWGVPGTLQTFVTLPADRAFHRPAGLPSVCGGAQIPLLTAWRALVELARLAPGESLLIHSAAGGVGHYAMEIARALGARVYATAGTAAKRARLLEQGAIAVFDSRTLDFAGQIREQTGQAGVDVVLNSLPGEALQQSFRLLAPQGRFVEIGKRDILEGQPLSLHGFHRNVSFFALDLDQADARLTASLRQNLADALHWVESGRIRLPAFEVFPADDAAAALRKMAGGSHSGRLVIDFRVPPHHPAPPRLPSPLIRRDRTYLVTGGLGELGMALARWLSAANAGRVLLVGRSAANPERLAPLQDGAANPDRIRYLSVDVSDPADCSRLRAHLAEEEFPLGGIFHAAGLVRDALVETMGPEDFAAPLAAKVAGAWNLHRIACEHDVDHFVMISSIASSWGSPGQTNYAAGNAFQDALAESRLHDGLPATAINFGPFSGPQSMAQRFERAAEFFQTIGLPLMPPNSIGDTIAAVLAAGRRRITVADVNWSSWIQGFPREAGEGRFRSVLSAAGVHPLAAETGRTAKRFAFAADDDRLDRVLTGLRELLARETQIPLAQIDPDSDLRGLGIDSLSSVTVDIQIRETFGVTIPFLQLFQEPSLRAIAERITARLEEENR